MGVLNIYHPDIEEYITAKSYDQGALTHFNMSVMVDDDFIEAVKNDKEIYLHFPVYDNKYRIIKNENQWQIKRKIKAKKLWDKIIRKAYDNGEPGILFYDNMNKDNNTYYTETITHTNPCGEFLGGTVFGQALSSENYGGACNLGSVFLHNMVDNPFTSNAKFNYEKLRKSIRVGVRFLDNIIDINNYPRQIYENYQKSFRTIGLGVTGLADMLTMLGLKYNTRQAQLFVYDLMNIFAFETYKNSIELAKEKGCFAFLDKDKFIQSGYIQKHLQIHPEWQEIVDGIKQHGIRNARLISIAPTGTISLTYGNNCSSGIEPIFNVEYQRKVKIGGQSDDNTQLVTMRDFAYDLWEKTKNKIVDKDVFITALDMSVDDHVNMLRNIAFHVDASVSKTINVPNDYSFEDTKNIYMKCWESGIKGCTIFRPNNIREGILITNDKKDNQNNTDETIVTEFPRGIIEAVPQGLNYRKYKLQTGCGKLYLFLGIDEDDGKIYDCFTNTDGVGGCTVNTQANSRLLSACLRGGVPIEYIIEQLNKSGTCPSFTYKRGKGEKLSNGKSCASAIANVLKDILREFDEDERIEKEEEVEHNNSNSYAGQDISITDKKNIKSQDISNNKNKMQKCPECGEYTLVFEGGCNSCQNCGYSKCG